MTPPRASQQNAPCGPVRSDRRQDGQPVPIWLRELRRDKREQVL